MSNQIEALQSALRKKRSELALSIRSHSCELDISEGEGELIDLVQGMRRRNEAVTLLNSLSCTLADVDAALIATKEGSYGTCNGCGETIAAKRLQAIPWALYCVQCQDMLDQGRQLEELYEYEDEAA